MSGHQSWLSTTPVGLRTRAPLTWTVVFVVDIVVLGGFAIGGQYFVGAESRTIVVTMLALAPAFVLAIAGVVLCAGNVGSARRGELSRDAFEILGSRLRTLAWIGIVVLAGLGTYTFVGGGTPAAIGAVATLIVAGLAWSTSAQVQRAVVALRT